MNHFASNSFQTLSFLQKSVTLSLNPFTIFCILKKTYFTRRMTMAKRKAVVSIQDCVSCGCCIKVCPRNAISIPDGIYANIHQDLCVGCGKCAKECPASVITLEVVGWWKKKRTGMITFGSLPLLIWSWGFSISYSPGWGFSASLFPFLSPLSGEIKPIVTDTAAEDSYFPLSAADLVFPGKKTFPGGWNPSTSAMDF